MMRLELKNSYLSIKSMPAVELPDFAVLIGRNGVGKTQLLDAVKNRHISVADIPTQEIDKYDMDTFRPNNAGQASWAGSCFAHYTAEKYFTEGPNSAPVEVAKVIFEETLKKFSLIEGSEERLKFEADLRESIRKMPAFSILQVLKTNEALLSYTQRIHQEVIQPLQSQNQGRHESRSDSCGNNPEVLICLAMKLAEKLPHEIERDDVLKAANYEGRTIQNTLSNLFVRYKVEQYCWAHAKGEQTEESFRSLMVRYRKETPPPWKVLREYLDLMREATGDPELFNFSFTDPEEEQLRQSDHGQYSFETKMTNRVTGESYSIENLSSGEKILMSLCFASFNQAIGRRQPKLILLDEIDAVLHPSMIKALLAILKERFVDKGTQVIMATHSVTTVAMLEEGEIYRVVRKTNGIEVHSVTQSQAVSELSEGIASIDTGLRIATSSVSRITILTEGYNSLHLKKWAELFFPGEVNVFEGLEGLAGASQLKTYGELLSKMNTNSHILIVWDWDAKQKYAEKLSEKLSGIKHVTAFSFLKRDNQIASKGIENKYDGQYLEEYAISTSKLATGIEINRSFDQSRKTEFAKHVYRNGNREYFEHFDDLHHVVKQILEDDPRSKMMKDKDDPTTRQSLPKEVAHESPLVGVPANNRGEDGSLP